MINYFKTYESPKQLKTADDYNCFDFMVKPALQVKLTVKEGQDVPQCTPTFDSITSIMRSCFDFIIESAKGLPRIETMLFTDLKLEDYLLHSVSIEEELVKSQVAAFGKLLIN